MLADVGKHKSKSHRTTKKASVANMKSLLFSPGPVMVEEPVREALMHYDICHRSPEFEEMFAGLQKKDQPFV